MDKKKIISGSLILAFLAAGLSSTAFPQDPTPFLGDWKGTIERRGAKMELVFHFFLGPDKKFAGAIDIPAASVFADALADLRVEGKTISFSLANGVAIKGTLDETGKILAMTWSGNGLDTNFTLTRTASVGEYSPRISIAEARQIIADGNREWGRARVALDKPTFERMLAPDFYVQGQGQGQPNLTRQQFIDIISANPPGIKLTRFDAAPLTVQPTEYGWVAIIHEKLEFERTANGRTETLYGLWITRDGWKKVNNQWVIAFSEVIGMEQWRGVRPPFLDW